MAIQMNIAEAKAKLSELVARAEAGEEVVIARDGVPVVVVNAIASAQAPRTIGIYQHLIPAGSWDPDLALDDDDPADWGEDEQIDAPPLAAE